VNAANLLVRRTVVGVAVALGALFAFGSVLAALLELQGFGDRDADPSAGYLLLLALGFAASVGIPLLLWRALLPGPSARALAGAALLATAGALLILGISLR
jgi:hypothetical protein